VASWANAKRQLAAWSALLAGACGHGGPTTPIHEVICRALPTRIFWIDETLDCRRSSDGPAAPFDVSCSGSRRSLTTTYPNLSAVTAEKIVPNRTYAVRRTFGGCGGFETAVTIAYDDARRTESWSNGEQRVRDADANIIREVRASRDASGNPMLSASDYAIQATEPTCTDPPGPPIG
jgi:hypothetical protein